MNTASCPGLVAVNVFITDNDGNDRDRGASSNEKQLQKHEKTSLNCAT